MKNIPFIDGKGRNAQLIVDSKPFRILGGEIHNSSASNLKYMEENVWPSMRLLGANSVVLPVYWECIEPEQGAFDFALVDGIIDQARKYGFRLTLLWFGLWKNGNSTYVPSWMKLDEKYFFVRAHDGHLIQCVSPLCAEAVEADARAFAALMAHLKEYDGDQNTVIMMQVENEIGVLGASRDCGVYANKLFSECVPDEICEIFGKSGSWTDVFGNDAEEYFMCYYYALAIEKIASRGKQEYPLPMYINCWLYQFPEEAGRYPSGGPIAERFDIWRPLTPSIDLYAPDIYVSHYRDICDQYADESNPLFIPEVRSSIDALPFLYYAIGKHNAIGFNPFGSEDICAKEAEKLDSSLMGELNIGIDALTTGMHVGKALNKGYRRILAMDDMIADAHREGRIFAFLQYNDQGKVFNVDGWTVTVTYAGSRAFGAPSMPREESAPVAGGYIIYLGNGEFVINAVSCTVAINAASSTGKTAFILRKEEGEYDNGKWIPGRILNGDEQMFMRFTMDTPLQRVKYYLR